MNEGDNLQNGIVQCTDKRESVVRYTLPEDNHQVLLPSISFTCRQRKNCARNCSVNILCWMMLCRMKQETSKARGVYSGKNVPLFRRNGYRKPGPMIP